MDGDLQINTLINGLLLMTSLWRHHNNSFLTFCSCFSSLSPILLKMTTESSFIRYLKFCDLFILQSVSGSCDVMMMSFLCFRHAFLCVFCHGRGYHGNS